MTGETFIKAQLAYFAQQQVGHMGGRDAMLAVLCILRNRVKAGWYGGDWIQNLNHAEERGSLEPIAPLPIDLTSPAFRRLLVDVEDVYQGQYKDELTRGGLYFLDSIFESHGRQVRPWFTDNILRQSHRHHRVAQVGMLWIFS